MKSNYRMGLFALLFTFAVSVLPVIAQACGNTGVIFSNEDMKFHSVPSRGYTVYRSVDGRYYPVTRYRHSCHGYWHHKHHKYSCHHRFVKVECQMREGYWISSHWYGASNVCWYK